MPKTTDIFLTLVLISARFLSTAQQMPDDVRSIFPVSTEFVENVSYAGDTLKRHKLDLYLPANLKEKPPLVVWIHGGAWMLNDKYADMGYMKNTISAIVSRGYAFASIDYRYSTEQKFPAQVRDRSQAIQFLYASAKKYHYDPHRIILIGFSAGGHLASLLALSLNDEIKDFHPVSPAYSIRGVVDFYGPSNLLLFYGEAEPVENDETPIGKLLGASPLKRPELAIKASPASYIDSKDPSFLIIHGEKDKDVPVAQSYLLQGLLNSKGIENELHVVKDAPHYGEMFDTPEVRKKVLTFLEKHFW